jgi:hypothetical protein
VKLARAFNISKLTKTEFNVLREMTLSGKVSLVIDRTYKLSDTQTAVRYWKKGTPGEK